MFFTGEECPVGRNVHRANVIPRFTNIASLSLVASTYLEKDYGFWAAYLLPLCSVWILAPLLLFWHKSFGRWWGPNLYHSVVILILESQTSATGKRSATGSKGHYVLGPRAIPIRCSKTSVSSREVWKGSWMGWYVRFRDEKRSQCL